MRKMASNSAPCHRTPQASGVSIVCAHSLAESSGKSKHVQHVTCKIRRPYYGTAACTVLRMQISGKKQTCTGKADMLGMHGKMGTLRRTRYRFTTRYGSTALRYRFTRVRPRRQCATGRRARAVRSA